MNFRSLALNYSGNVGKLFPQFEKISASTARVLVRFLMSDFKIKLLMHCMTSVGHYKVGDTINYH